VISSHPDGCCLGTGGALEKYEPLRDHLAGYTAGDQLLLSFEEIEELVGPLPRGARRLRQWWTNGVTAQARSWQAAGWRVVIADTDSEQVLFEQLWPVPSAPPSAGTSKRAEPAERSYLDDVHLPLLGVLVVLSVILGAIGFALRPGTDKPPVVPNTDLTLNVYQQGASGTPSADPTRVIVDETMEQQNPSTVLVQLDIFATFADGGLATWSLLGSRSSSQPHSCPDPYDYLGTAEPDPVNSEPGSQVTIGGQPVSKAELANFTGRTSDKNASNVLGLYGQAPGTVRADSLAPIAEADLCWTGNPPMAFDGEFASASLPGITEPSEISDTVLPLDLTRDLYFDNYQENQQPVTAQYLLQAGTLPTSTNAYGWHWTADPDDASVQLTATNIQVSQHEAYLGFVSGVLFGIVGGALVLILQELLEPIRIRRRARRETTA
jgi:hypothetical protein